MFLKNVPNNLLTEQRESNLHVVFDLVERMQPVGGRELVEAANEAGLMRSTAAEVIESLCNADRIDRVHAGPHRWVYEVAKPYTYTRYQRPLAEGKWSKYGGRR